MTPTMRKAIDVLTAIALTAAAFFIIVVANSFLMARGGYGQGITIWYAFIRRPDILGTMVLTALVTMAYLFWKQNGRPRL
jgi:Ni,Fe-hydrogenase I cytochrome b subunit